MTHETDSGETTRRLCSEAADAFRDYRAGDTGRMSDLVRMLSPALWAVARSCGLSVAQAEDVLQTAWARLVQNSEAVREPQAVFGWLLTTTRREAWRAASRTSPVVPESMDEAASPDPGPEEIAADEDTHARLWQHVRRLNSRCQALLRVIAYASTPDYAQISEALGMPVGSIGPTRGRCLATLRKSLANDPGWSPW